MGELPAQAAAQKIVLPEGAPHESEHRSPGSASSGEPRLRAEAVQHEADLSAKIGSPRKIQRLSAFLGLGDAHMLTGKWESPSQFLGVFTVEDMIVSSERGNGITIPIEVRKDVLLYLGFAALREQCSENVITWVKGRRDNFRSIFWHRRVETNTDVMFVQPRSASRYRARSALRRDVHDMELEPQVSSEKNSKFFANAATLTGGGKKWSRKNEALPKDKKDNAEGFSSKAKSVEDRVMSGSPLKRKARTMHDILQSKLGNEAKENYDREAVVSSKRSIEDDETNILKKKRHHRQLDDGMASRPDASKVPAVLAGAQSWPDSELQDHPFFVKNEQHLHDDVPVTSAPSASMQMGVQLALGREVKDEAPLASEDHRLDDDVVLNSLNSGPPPGVQVTTLRKGLQEADVVAANTSSTSTAGSDSLDVLVPVGSCEATPSCSSSDVGARLQNTTPPDILDLQEKLDRLPEAETDRLRAFLGQLIASKISDDDDEIEFDICQLPQDKRQVFEQMVAKMVAQMDAELADGGDNAPPKDGPVLAQMLEGPTKEDVNQERIFCCRHRRWIAGILDRQAAGTAVGIEELGCACDLKTVSERSRAGAEAREIDGTF